MAKRLKRHLHKKKVSGKKEVKPFRTEKVTTLGTERGTRRERRPSMQEVNIRPREFGLVNRNIFNDPFFNEPWEDLFNFPSVENIMSTARNFKKRALKGMRDIERTTPAEGSKFSRSLYRSSSNLGGDTKGELISHESVSNYDEQGKKFTEKRKTYENVKDKVLKTTHVKMIDDKGIKHMKTRYLDSGEEYEHTDFKHMNEKDLPKFNEDFRRGIKGGLTEQKALGTQTTLPALGPSSEMDFDRDRFGLALPSLARERPLMVSPWDRFGMFKDMMGGFGDWDRWSSGLFDRFGGIGDFGRFGPREREYGIGTPTTVGDQERIPPGKKSSMSYSETKPSEKGKVETTSSERASSSRRR